MTFSARITAPSCLLALLAGYGSALAGPAGRGGSGANWPQSVFPFATAVSSRDGPVASLAWRQPRSTTGGCQQDCTAAGQPWWISRSGTGNSFFQSHSRVAGCSGYCETPVWTATADALLLWRSPARSQGLLFAPAINRPDVVLLDAADMQFSVQAFPRITLTRHLFNECFLEVSYLGIDGWTFSTERQGNPLALFPPGILVSSRFNVDYESAFHSAELNLRRRCLGRLDLLAGVRWGQLRESFHVVGPNPLSPSFPNVRYDTLVGNSMYGFQIGARDIFFDRGGPLRVDGFIKTGIYANSGNQEISTFDNLGNQAAASARGDHTSMLAELGFSVLYRLGDHLAARCGYQAMWLDGVALAPDQIATIGGIPSPAAPVTLDADGGLLYHGFHLGLEAHW